MEERETFDLIELRAGTLKEPNFISHNIHGHSLSMYVKSGQLEGVGKMGAPGVEVHPLVRLQRGRASWRNHLWFFTAAVAENFGKGW